MPVITSPHLNGLSGLACRRPRGAQCGSFKPCILLQWHFKKKKMYYRFAALVNVMPFSPVWEESQPWRWSKNPKLSNQQEAGRLEEALKKRERERRRNRIDGHTMHLAQGGRQTEGGETTIKCNRCNRICHIYAQMRHSNDCYALS